MSIHTQEGSEIWLRVLCAVLSNSNLSRPLGQRYVYPEDVASVAAGVADAALKEYTERLKTPL